MSAGPGTHPLDQRQGCDALIAGDRTVQRRSPRVRERSQGWTPRACSRLYRRVVWAYGECAVRLRGASFPDPGGTPTGSMAGGSGGTAIPSLRTMHHGPVGWPPSIATCVARRALLRGIHHRWYTVPETGRMSEVHECPECGKPATPHCTSSRCPWLTCTKVKCGTTWHPGRPEITLRIVP